MRAKTTVVFVVITLMLASGTAFALDRKSSGPTYRTATAQLRDVEQVLDETGSIEPVSQATVAFPVSGTIETVDVGVGDRVSVGQTLASLDTQSLESSVTQAKASLAQAELNLERALNGESTSGGSSPTAGANGSSGSPTGQSQAVTTAAESRTSTTAAVLLVSSSTTAQTATTPSSVPGGGGPPVGGSDIGAAQQAVVAAQHQVDLDLQAVQQAMDLSDQLCGSLDSSSSSSDLSACYAELTAVTVAQKSLATAQQQLAQASAALDALLAAEAAKSGGSSSPPSNPTGKTGGSATTGPPSSSSSSTAASSGATSPSAADLAADQKSVDATKANLAEAQQAVEQATIVSPIAGTVLSVGMTVGDEVSANSSTANIVVSGDGGYEVTTSVKVTDLPAVALGQPARVLPDGESAAISGRVVQYAHTSSSSSSSTTYRVTIGFGGTTSAALRNGTTASVSILTASSSRTLAVPTSAVTVQNGRSTVTLLEHGKTKTVSVKTGAVGSTWTAIESGLDRGDTVVLADLSQPLPSSATSSSSGQSGQTTGRTGFTPGAGFRPGG